MNQRVKDWVSSEHLPLNELARVQKSGAQVPLHKQSTTYVDIFAMRQIRRWHNMKIVGQGTEF